MILVTASLPEKLEMNIDSAISFGITNWESIFSERHEGTTGFAIWKVRQFGTIRVRMVEYSKNYLADHWCDKGHIIFCVEGEMMTELKDGQKFSLRKGMSYQVGDNADSHRTQSAEGVKLFIVD
jgi:mannose-6-phosphate isomerase class I